MVEKNLKKTLTEGSFLILSRTMLRHKVAVMNLIILLTEFQVGF